MPEQIAGKYRIVRLLGEGGMGQVFEAVNRNTERRVAIKTLHPRLVEDDLLVQRFLREARAATRVRHPNVVDVLDLDVDPTTKAPYLVQEFLVGESLADALDARRDRRFEVDEALGIIVPVLRALAAAHAVGIVHRDLKPDNIFLVRDAQGAVTPKIIDFGIAKVLEGQGEGIRMTQTGAVMGTPGYMSPEQAGGSADLDGRTDVWSIGVVLYELLVGRIPFDAPNYNLLVAKILYEEPTPILQVDPTLRRDVAAVVHRALTRSLDARFPSMQAMLDATLSCLGDAATRETDLPAPPTGPATVPPRAASVTSPPFDKTLVPGASEPASPALSAPTLAATAPTPPIPTLASWTGQRSPETRRSNAPTVAVAAVLVAALAGSAWWFSRPPPPLSSAAALRAPTAPAVTRVAPVATPVAVAMPAAADASTEAVAPTSQAFAAPNAPRALDASVEPGPTAPSASTLAAPSRSAHGRRHRAHGNSAHGDGDFDRGYPQ